MFKFNFRIAIRQLIGFVLFLILFPFAINAQQMTKISGKMTCANVEGKAFENVSSEGHRFSISQAEGININAGSNLFMDGAQVMNTSFADLINGNGPYQGYIKLVKKDDAAMCKWQGKITTTLIDGIPMVTFEGTFTYIDGSGAFRNIKGKGTYKGKFISKNIYLVEWEGEYSTN